MSTRGPPWQIGSRVVAFANALRIEPLEERNMRLRTVVTTVGCILALAAFSATAQAATFTVNDFNKVSPCSLSGGPHARDYAYQVVSDGSQGLQEFWVGLDTTAITEVEALDASGNALAGWSYVVDQPGTLADPYTNHGVVSGHSKSTKYKIIWTGNTDPGAGTYWFSFNCPEVPEDVGWYIGGGYSENWSIALANADFGPVHGPLPEPATCALLALGGLVALRRKQRS